MSFTGWGRAAAVSLVLSTGACAPASRGALPSADAVVAYYSYDRSLTAEVVGNVAVISVEQSAQQLRTGGSLWAKVGPYIFLFSDETRKLLEDYPGLAAVRVITRVGDAEVSNALLRSDDLNDVLWRRSLNIAGLARRDGTKRMTLLEDLVEWGEDHTEFTYNERYTRR
jgi:hypothetical protein